jgi:hypothetical protein
MDTNVKRFITRLALTAIDFERTARRFDDVPGSSAHYFRGCRDVVLVDYAAALHLLADAPGLDNTFVTADRQRWHSAALASAVVFADVCPDCLSEGHNEPCGEVRSA